MAKHSQYDTESRAMAALRRIETATGKECVHDHTGGIHPDDALAFLMEVVADMVDTPAGPSCERCGIPHSTDVWCDGRPR